MKTATQHITPKSGTVTRIDPSVETRISQFIARYSYAGAGLLECSRQLVELVAIEEHAFELIMEREPSITAGSLQTLYLCGKHGIDPRLVIDNPVAMRRLLPLPTAQVQNVIASGLPVVRGNGNGNRVSVIKHLRDITASDAAIAIGPKGIRTTEEQTKIKQERESHLKKNRPRYTITTDGAVTFYHNSTFTAVEIEAIAAECKTAAIKSLAKKK